MSPRRVESERFLVEYVDSRKPYWYMVEIEFVRKLDEPQGLEKLRGVKAPGDGSSQ